MFSPCFFIHSSLVSTVMTITSNFLSGKLLITILLVAFPSCSFTGNSLLSPHFIWLPVFLLVKWNKYLFQSWRRALCRSDFCVDYMCWVALASWLELKSVHAVPEVPWQNYWQGLEQAQGRVSQGCCSRGPMAGQLAGAGAGVGTGWGGPGYGVITVQEG